MHPGENQACECLSVRDCRNVPAAVSSEHGLPGIFGHHQVKYSHVQALTKLAQDYPDPLEPEACERFSHQVRLIEGVLTTTYTLAVDLTKQSDSLEEIASLWQQMGNLCNLALEIVKASKDRYPYCGTPQLYDRLLDYKWACSSRYERVSEEISCQKIPLPMGLFPALN